MKVKKILLRVLVVLVWAGVWMGLLYSSHLLYLFRRKPTLTIAAWSDILDPELLTEFADREGIRIKLTYFTSNEELLVKLKKSDGKGFDLIIPSDYAIKLLHDEGLLKKIDRSKLTFFDDLNPMLLGHSFDPHNGYSVPLFWEIYGVGVNKELFTAQQMQDPWDLIFNNQSGYWITMVNDPLEMMMLASLYLYGRVPFKEIPPLTPDKIHALEDLLHTQKKYVKAYVDFRGDYFLATKNCAAIVSSSSYIFRSQKLFPFISFLVPAQTFVTIENCALSCGTEQEELVYRLLNYLYQPEHVVHHCTEFSFFPSTLSALPLLEGTDQQKALAFFTPADFSRLLFFKKQMDQIDLIRVWARVKS